ncbi:winged helix-turn-helix transcriptional regulator [Streptomyces sp. NPDC021100]|uniref:winged helix-turn-helix transcriptional regulator n=1 Tax=Streptomyces sp. NPDC021100 TaxID=3365114 RepID=UPI0037AB86CD
MATTGLPPTTHTDLSRVTETLEMIAPRWSAWVLMTLAERPLRYAEIKPKLPWLADGQLHPRLRKLTEAGLVERTAYAPRHVTYGLTRRGAELMPVLAVIATWGNTHLEKDLVPNAKTGELEPERIAAADTVEDSLVLITPRHATPLLWTLKARGSASAKSLAADAMPGYNLSTVYPPLRQLIDDGLVDVTDASVFRLSATGQALAPVYSALSAWAAGRQVATAPAHVLWGPALSPSQGRTGTWVTHHERQPASRASEVAAAPAVSAAQRPAARWQPGDLFSHQVPARPIAAPPAGGHRR